MPNYQRSLKAKGRRFLTNPSLSRRQLAPYALLGSAIAFAGPPIYMLAPNAYAERFGLSLASLGLVLFWVRLIDFIQDPILAKLSHHFVKHQRVLLVVFAGVLMSGVGMLFWPGEISHPLFWFGLSVVVSFTGFSAMQIMFYGLGVRMAKHQSDHAKIAAWRETGVLLGICAAVLTPSVAALMIGARFQYLGYSVVLGTLMIIALFLLARTLPNETIRTKTQSPTTSASFLALLGDRPFRRLLGLGLLNTLPFGFTATLFFFFVSDRLMAPNHAGPMLLLFFLSAALCAPLWANLATKIGKRNALIWGLVGAIFTFIWASMLGTGDVIAFYVICALSGAALAADFTLLPAILSQRLKEIGGETLAFGLWGGVTKFSLAIAAGIALPALSFFGYAPNTNNSADALRALSLLYAAVPCVLKVSAVAILTRLENEKEIAT